MAKVKIGDLIKGAGTGWLQPNADEQATIRRQQLADMRMGGTQMPTRTRGGGVRQPGISESELNDIQQQPAGDVLKPRDLYSGSDAAKQRAEVLGARRAGGNLPEQRTPIDRTRRTGVDESKVTDPKRVQEFADMIQKDGGGDETVGHTGYAVEVSPVSGYDDILKMMRHDALAEGDMARRQHNREVMTGLGDLVSSIANLWSTTKGGPNGYDNSKGMTATVQARYANDLARRRAQQEQILNYYRVKKAAEDDAETREYRRGMLEIKRQEAETKAKKTADDSKRADDLNNARVEESKARARYNQSKANGDLYDATFASSYRKYRTFMTDEAAREQAAADAEEARLAALQQEQNDKHENAEAKTQREKSATAKNNRTGKGGGRSGGRGSSNKGYTEDVEYKYDDDGNKVGYTKTRKPAGYTKPKRQNTNRGYTKPGKK